MNIRSHPFRNISLLKLFPYIFVSLAGCMKAKVTVQLDVKVTIHRKIEALTVMLQMI